MLKKIVFFISLVLLINLYADQDFNPNQPPPYKESQFQDENFPAPNDNFQPPNDNQSGFARTDNIPAPGGQTENAQENKPLFDIKTAHGSITIKQLPPPAKTDSDKAQADITPETSADTQKIPRKI